MTLDKLYYMAIDWKTDDYVLIISATTNNFINICMEELKLNSKIYKYTVRSFSFTEGNKFVIVEDDI